MRIVVTGAKGFIGSVFSRFSHEFGHEVLSLDDESRGLNPVERYIGPRYHKHDCRNGIYDVVKERFDSIDAVVHFAAATGSLERPIEELRELNVDMCKRVYEDALRLGAKAFAWPTTSLAIEVPDSPYVQSKEEALAMLKEVDAKARISVPVRFFNVAGNYGDLTERRKREVHVIPHLVKCFQTGDPFIVNGTNYDTVDGTPSRDLVNVLDVVRYLLFNIRKRIDGEDLPVHPKDGAIWTGTGSSLTVRQMIALFSNACGSGKLSVVDGPRRAFDCARLTVDPAQRKRFEQVMGTLIPPSLSLVSEAKTLIDLT